MAKNDHNCIVSVCRHIDYTKDELEFMAAIQAWQLRKGRKFPAWSEVLSVLRELGYRKTGGMLSDYLAYRKLDRHGHPVKR